MQTPLILLVNDESQNLAMLRQMLSASYKLAFARNGAEACLAVAQRLQPALILLDIRMPEWTATTSAKRLASTQNIPVIFVTGLDNTGSEASGFAVGGVDYIINQNQCRPPSCWRGSNPICPWSALPCVAECAWNPHLRSGNHGRHHCCRAGGYGRAV